MTGVSRRVYERFNVRLRTINTPEQLREAEAGCAILGHDKSGEFFATHPPFFTCFWCFGEFRDETRPFVRESDA
jgi:hypothetical protein